MVNVHENGWIMKIRDHSTRVTVQKTMFCTSKDCFDGLVQLLKGSKKTCESIMKSERIHTVIGNPFDFEIRAIRNPISNKKKGEKIRRTDVVLRS